MTWKGALCRVRSSVEGRPSGSTLDFQSVRGFFILSAWALLLRHCLPYLLATLTYLVQTTEARDTTQPDSGIARNYGYDFELSLWYVIL